MTLVDGGGVSASKALIDLHDGLKYPDFADFPPGHSWLGTTRERKNIPLSFRMPLADFAGLDLTQIVEVAFYFNLPDATLNGIDYDNDSGGVTIDDVEFTR